MKIGLTILISLLLFGNGNGLRTQKFGGSYNYGKDIEKERIGLAEIYPETDSTILFYLDLNRGAPSYNMGEIYGRLLLKDNVGTYYSIEQHDPLGCKLLFTFSKNTLAIKTLEGQYHCGFGAAVYADGIFKRRKQEIPKYFIGPTGDTTYFKKVTPDKYEPR